jgi:hypothetical protein
MTPWAWASSRAWGSSTGGASTKEHRNLMAGQLVEDDNGLAWRGPDGLRLAAGAGDPDPLCSQMVHRGGGDFDLCYQATGNS